MPNLRFNDSLRWYWEDLTHRVVANSGIPSDRHHLGKIILRSLQDDLYFTLQIDGGTGEEESSGSVLKKSIRCATALRNFGLKYADVVLIMVPNHLNAAIPFYACLYLGLIIAPVDINLSSEEIQQTINNYKPKMIFCQHQKSSMIQEAIDNVRLDTKIITFDKGNNYAIFENWLEKYGDDIEMKNFRPEDFDPADTVAFLTATSGTTGLPKAASLTHKNFCIGTPVFWTRSHLFPGPTQMFLLLSPLQWLTASLNFVLSAILRYTRLQTSKTLTVEHVLELIKTYKPTSTFTSPTFMASLLKSDECAKCDFSCIEIVMLGGSAVSQELSDEVMKVMPHTNIAAMYGMSELTTYPFVQADIPVPGSIGRPVGYCEYRLVDIETQKDINEANVPGELWIKGPSVFKGYYNNAEATSEVMTEDGWLKTGDVLYRDAHCNYYFVDRIKALLKYRNHHVSPVELENVIRRHSGVSDVAVCGIADRECGELPVACVVRRPGHSVTAQDIKDLVKNSLTDTKQLRGGVIFMEQLPLTVTSKIARYKLKELVSNLARE